MEHLADIAIFVKVVDLGSFTAAATALESSQPVVSKAVNRLEQRLGVRLLNRTTRRLSLTEAGAELYRQGAQAIAALDNVQLEIARFQTEPRGTLRVNAPNAFTVLHLQQKLPSFLERNPSVVLDLTTEDRMVDLIEEGYDAAVRIGRLESSTLIARKIAPCRQVICASPAYIARHSAPEEVEDLLSHNCIVYTLGRDARSWCLLNDNNEEVLLPVRGNAAVNNGLVGCGLGIEGVGLTLLPTFYVGDALRSGKLVRVLPKVRLPELGLYVVYPERRNALPKLRAFIDFMITAFGPEPEWDRGLSLT
jgi:DNA-binding transcriptional LysR family regulator